ncbi:hypothetical protein MES4922_480006 [Mesorhizobium ventifaucium]|uniref:Uncharacterized protein n=1 Tax=Mesorhizobium ventifaucium TaxID=666020 RepID=A0ABM9EBN1_9HYPH|nr:hypothetical protein MES4922_480006 [Mesorhizobium ventifaucium]
MPIPIARSEGSSLLRDPKDRRFSQIPKDFSPGAIPKGLSPKCNPKDCHSKRDPEGAHRCYWHKKTSFSRSVRGCG